MTFKLVASTLLWLLSTSAIYAAQEKRTGFQSGQQTCDYEHLDATQLTNPNTDPNCHVFSTKFNTGFRAIAGTQLVLPNGNGFICGTSGTYTSTIRYASYPFDAMTPLGVSVACFQVVQQAVAAGSLVDLIGPLEGAAALPATCNVTVTITAAYDSALVGLSDTCSYNPPPLVLPSPLSLLLPQSLSKTPVKPCLFSKIRKSGVTQISYTVTPGGVLNLPNLGVGAGSIGLCLDDLTYVGETCCKGKCAVVT